MWKCGSAENKDIQINTHKVNTLHIVLTPLLNIVRKKNYQPFTEPRKAPWRKKTEVFLRDPEKEFFPCIYRCLVVNEFNQNHHMSCDECVALHQELSTDVCHLYKNHVYCKVLI